MRSSINRSELAWTCDLALGYRFDSVATDGTQFDRSDHTWYLGLTCPLINPARPDRYLILPDKELTFKFLGQWELDKYRNGNLIDWDEDKRSDLITTLTFQISQRLIEDPGGTDMILHLAIEWMNADSNVTQRNGVSPLTFERVVYGVQLEWLW